MSFCMKCGNSVNANDSFCLKCGFNLKSSNVSPTHVPISSKYKGGMLEDSIAKYFKSMGFDVQLRQRMRDRYDVSHEIDVLATKKESFGRILIAVECKYVKNPIEIKEVRNFHDKLIALGITKGIFISTAGFTSDAEAHADALSIELWDGKKLKDKFDESEAPETSILYDAIAFPPAAISAMAPKHLSNSNLFVEKISLLYRPFYFIDYHCFSQFTVASNVVDIESKGKIIIDALNGHIVDSRIEMGQAPTLPNNGPLVGCLSAPIQTVRTDIFPKELPLSVLKSEINSGRAKDLAKIELAKNLSRKYTYYTRRSTNTKHLKAKKKDIDILNVQQVKIPILTGTYQYKNYTYTRLYVAPTGLFIIDQTLSCVQCKNSPTIICEECGAISCQSHKKNCLVCGKNLCNSCAVSKGIISKKYYCVEHKPKE